MGYDHLEIDPPSMADQQLLWKFLQIPSWFSVLTRVCQKIVRTIFWVKVRQVSCIVPLSTTRGIKLNGVVTPPLVLLVFKGLR